MKFLISMLAIVPIFLAGCAAEDQSGAARRACRPEAATQLVRHPVPDDARIKWRTGADVIRRIAPGDMVTHDFRENRITIAVDPSGEVVQAICG